MSRKKRTWNVTFIKQFACSLEITDVSDNTVSRIPVRLYEMRLFTCLNHVFVHTIVCSVYVTVISPQLKWLSDTRNACVNAA